MVELVVGGREGLIVGWVVERKLTERKSETEAEYRD